MSATRSGGAAVYIAGFDEVADYLAAAADESGPRQPQVLRGSRLGDERRDPQRSGGGRDGRGVRWLSEPAAHAAGGPGATRGRTIDKIERKSGQKTKTAAFSLAAYDALGLAVETLQAAGPDPSAAALRLHFAAAADGYDGMTGDIVLNDAGDRASGAFAFWAVCEARKGYEWRAIGSWTPSDQFGEPATVRLTSCSEAAG